MEMREIYKYYLFLLSNLLSSVTNNTNNKQALAGRAAHLFGWWTIAFIGLFDRSVFFLLLVGNWDGFLSPSAPSEAEFQAGAVVKPSSQASESPDDM